MRISPVLLAWLLIWSFLFGVVLAIVNAAARSVSSLINGKNHFALKSATRKAEGGQARSVIGGAERTSGLVKGVGLVYTFVLDVCVFLFAGAGILLLSYYFNYGEIRGICAVGVALGFILGHLMLGRMLRGIFERIMFAFGWLISWFFKVTVFPLTIFLNFCKKTLKFLLLKVVNAIEKRTKVLYNNNKLLYILISSVEGFVFLNLNGVENNDQINRKE